MEEGALLFTYANRGTIYARVMLAMIKTTRIDQMVLMYFWLFLWNNIISVILILYSKYARFSTKMESKEFSVLKRGEGIFGTSGTL